MLDATPLATQPGPRAVAFHLPQFHPTPENDRFWGPGFTEWRNIVRARPRFTGHDQPHLPADLEQRYSDADTVAHARHLAAVFADPRYIRVAGRPAFAVYNADELPNPRRWTDLFRETSLKQGKEPYLIRVERHLDRDTRPPAALVFDAALEFQPFSRNYRRWQFTRPDLKRHLPRRIAHWLRREAARLRSLDTHVDMAAFVDFDMNQPPPVYPWFPGVCPSWDNTARRPPGKAIIIRNSSPALFSRWVAAKARSITDLVFVNAWNEWAESNHLKPSLTHGHTWLDALREGLSDAAAERAHVACKRTSL